ncbi:MAG: disulfide reductase [Clostridiales bacterium]|jgi:heterodisulfide reductase subunit B|nr:disulfide reductase [Clostridiales bacterium]
MNFDYYPGCTLKTKAAGLEAGARRAARALGFELCEIADWQCCGAVYPLGKDAHAEKLPSIRALKAAENAARPLVTLCSACHHVLKRVNDDAAKNKDFRDTIARYDEDLAYGGGATVLHYLEVLRDFVGFEELSRRVVKPLTGRKIGAYYGCMLLRPSVVMAFDDPENPTIIEDFIRALGGEAVNYPLRAECCGGYISLSNEAKANELSRKILADAARLDAEFLITACPLCAYNIRKQNQLPIYYFTEILEEALDVKL